MSPGGIRCVTTGRPNGAKQGSPGQRPGNQSPPLQLALKGRNRSSPRGDRDDPSTRGVGALQDRNPRSPVRPFQGGGRAPGAFPRAPAWAFLSRPFGAEEPCRGLHVSHPDPRHSSPVAGRCLCLLIDVSSPVPRHPATAGPATTASLGRRRTRGRSGSRICRGPMSMANPIWLVDRARRRWADPGSRRVSGTSPGQQETA